MTLKLKMAMSVVFSMNDNFLVIFGLDPMSYSGLTGVSISDSHVMHGNDSVRAI